MPNALYLFLFSAFWAHLNAQGVEARAREGGGGLGQWSHAPSLKAFQRIHPHPVTVWPSVSAVAVTIVVIVTMSPLPAVAMGGVTVTILLEKPVSVTIHV